MRYLIAFSRQKILRDLGARANRRVECCEIAHGLGG